ncbi:putative f-box protein [Phaeoacremonium minimum UCRPA7]|uniref:Putative f-box protein n=1 Tax=Phaeoacremonium minimum (strain UCR-PA7) TaxID=1286976 RepID=R8BMZ9_PHAM7|nr:putative f-box protein [Phaeoacremonium minimum UCRPA7]EOO00726.1 putative f-box protein [Phaeoacremonium minimum UCRPA7]
MDPSRDTASELDSFREQWRAEVRARNPPSRSQQSAAGPSNPTSRPSRGVPERPKNFVAASKTIPHDVDDEFIQTQVFEEPEGSEPTNDTQLPAESRDGKGPVSALDHYEQAVEKEAQGSLGDSLRLYRKAFRMDHRVDQKYKNKYFAAAWAQKPQQAGSSVAPGTSAAAKAPEATLESQPQSMKELLASFAGLSIEPAPPEIEGMPQPPCPIASLPEEILIHILQDVAVEDVGDFVRLAQVCKRFAWLVATEDRIWRRICIGSEVGFGGMHYDWQKGVSWEPLGEFILEDDAESVARSRQAESLVTTNALLGNPYTTWQRMFRQRPRIRFNGCYISTVNYIRAGQASAHQITWNSPVHIVTYYRYLRFFRDGTVISLLTTDEPSSVVHHLTKDLLALHQDGAMAHLPSIVMQFGLKGRWRLSSALDNPDVSPAEAEGELFVETDGVGPKYMYRMELSLKSAGKGARNNKLIWKGFYSYNKLTDDWGEFGLKNDKPFFFSRVKSYGIGE